MSRRGAGEVDDVALVAERPLTATLPLISLQGASKSFRRKGRRVQALTDVHLDIAPGELVTLLGPSGCGKSTLLRIIGGLTPSDGGVVTVAGDDPRRARARKQFGFVPQAPALLPWRTVRSNVRLLNQVNRGAEGHRTPDDAEVAELVEAVGLTPFLDAYPRELSGGMQQRVSLVRAFSLGAPVLLMDEPFAALDEITRAEMRYLLLDIWQRSGGTVVFVTHSIAEAVSLSDRVVVLAARPGRVVDIVPIDLPRPRREVDEDSPVFLAHVRRIREALHGGWTR